MTDQIWAVGTVTLTTGSTAVTGDGTGWQTALVTGGTLCPEAAGNTLPIASVEGEEALTAAVKWQGASGTYAYAIVRETAEAVRAAWTNDRLAQIIQRLSLVGIHPDGSGTLTERDALDPVPDDGYLWLYAEPSNDLGFYRKTASGWDGPFPVQGEAGAASTVPGPAGDGFNPLGAYDSGTTYAANDFVTFGGRNFVSLVDSNTGNEPPSTDADDAYWMFIPVANGTDGKTILSGTSDPTTEGVDGDFYIRTDTQYLFGPKAAGTWPAGVNLNGTNGTDGRTILSGAVDPTTEGADGDFYINTSSTTLFGPKASGTWPAGVYIGPGSDGSDGAVWDTGATDPDNGSGANGDFYLQNGTGSTGVLGDIWTKAAGTWSITSNIRGASGAGTGDVVGPAGATANGFVKWDGTTGKLVKDSAATITAAEVSDFSTAADARVSAAIGSTVQAYAANLTAWAAVTPSSYLTTSAAASAYQPLDSDLTSWAGVTRAAGFDTFASTPSSANLRALLSDEVGTGAAYFVGGALGTPASATLTNATGLPAAGLVASTSQAVGFGSIELGHATDTTLSRGAAGFIAVEGNRVPSPASQASGDVLYRGSTEWERLAKGTANQVLAMNAAATAPEWKTSSGGSPDYGAGNAALSYGGIGTYVFGLFLAGSGIAAGATIAGSSLEPAGLFSGSGSLDDDVSTAGDITKGGSALSGTWRAMGQSNSTGAGNNSYVTLFLRIS